MPGFDGSGPAGTGPMRGGARGYCMLNEDGFARQVRPGGFSRRQTYGCGMRRGFRHFWGRCYGPDAYSLTTEEDLAILKQRAESVKTTLDLLNKRIAELEK